MPLGLAQRSKTNVGGNVWFDSPMHPLMAFAGKSRRDAFRPSPGKPGPRRPLDSAAQCAVASLDESDGRAERQLRRGHAGALAAACRCAVRIWRLRISAFSWKPTRSSGTSRNTMPAAPPGFRLRAQTRPVESLQMREVLLTQIDSFRPASAAIKARLQILLFKFGDAGVSHFSPPRGARIAIDFLE